MGFAWTFFSTGGRGLPTEVRFFGRGGMTAKNYDIRLMEQLTAYHPDFVIVNIGGNDIRCDTAPKVIANDILKLISDIRKFDITVVFCDICERGKFPRDPLLTKTSFNSQRKKINKLIKNHVNTISPSMRFPKDYDQDEVHFNDRGMTKYFYFLQRYMLSLRKVN